MRLGVREMVEGEDGHVAHGSAPPHGSCGWSERDGVVGGGTVEVDGDGGALIAR